VYKRQEGTYARLHEKLGAHVGTIDGVQGTHFAVWAPNALTVSVIGDFNDWSVDPAYYMNVTPDKKRYWLSIDNLTPKQEYIFQYLVDGNIRIGDPYADKVSDPDDKYIPSSTYPGLKQYPYGKTNGPATFLQTDQDAYVWTTTNYTPPKVTDLVVYELLVRDFTSARTFNAIIDTLDYLKRLGINAIELMPIMEFEGNSSWGYNPDYLFAVDKNYGTKDHLKNLIDQAHAKGIAILFDIVVNHQFGQSPLVKLYWDGSAQAPAANSPWFNQVPRHPYNVGFDFNHESFDTKMYFERNLTYWITEYKIDGYRFDLSKGLTQRNSYPNNMSYWAAYDESRISILNNYNNVMKSVKPNIILILEHFADNAEEKVLSSDGMLLWGNLNGPYGEASMGYNANNNSDFSWGAYTTRGWTQPNLVTYMESHDEERIMYKNIAYGADLQPGYDLSLIHISEPTRPY
jgi:1,4-alpha-glucan branching enzyme